MAITKRLRYEVLRRDNFTCRYCGAPAPTVELTVDHVIPKALGGTDHPSNLASSCLPCNQGKSSTTPDGPTVDQVDADAIAWASRVRAALAQLEAADLGVQPTAQRLLHTWPPNHHLPDNAEESIARFLRLGISTQHLEALMRRAVDNPKISNHERFRYLMGMCWRTLDDAHTIARGTDR